MKTSSTEAKELNKLRVANTCAEGGLLSSATFLPDAVKKSSDRLYARMINRMKRTTLMLDDGRLAELKSLAAERGKALSELVDEFLADGIRRARNPRRRIARLPVFGMGEPRVDIADRDQLGNFIERDGASPAG